LDTALVEELRNLTTPHLADGCLRVGVPIRFAPAGVRPLVDGMCCVGRARPVRHVGSIDIFLEAFEQSEPGEVLVIDNGGRRDEACIGDIIVLEAQAAGLAGFVIWGLHRDNKELEETGFPVFSLGAVPAGPQRLHIRPPDVFARAAFDRYTVTADDFVVADTNGVLFLPIDRLVDIVAAAKACRETEGKQIRAMKEGQTYRSQTRFAGYLERRKQDPGYGFRQHLRDIEAAGEV